MAITAIAALASAGGVAAGVVAIETLAIIATVTSVVGAVTGNKTLQKIGMGMGLASAGAGMLASSEGAAGAAANTALDQSAAETARLAGKESILAGAENASTNLVAQEATGGIVSNATSAIDTSLAGAPDVMGVTPLADEAAQATSIANTPTAAAEASNATNATSNSAFKVGDITTPSDSVAKMGANAPTGPTSPYDSSLGGKDPFGANTVDDTKSFFGNAWDKTTSWLDKNPKTANTLLQVGGNIATGIAKSAEADRLYALQSQQLQMQQKQAANANSVPTIGSIINPNYVRSGPGIVSNALGK